MLTGNVAEKIRAGIFPGKVSTQSQAYIYQTDRTLQKAVNLLSVIVQAVFTSIILSCYFLADNRTNIIRKNDTEDVVKYCTLCLLKSCFK